MLIEFEKAGGGSSVMVRLVIEGPPQRVVCERSFPVDPRSGEGPPSLVLKDGFATFKIHSDDLFLTLPPGSYER